MNQWHAISQGGLFHGDCREFLSQLPDGFANCCVTSPPYFGLRDYGHQPSAWPAVEYAPMPGMPSVTVPAMECCLGLEPTPEAFIGHLVLVFREVRRVLRDDGTLWLNLGDSYAANRGYQVPDSKHVDVGNCKGMKAATVGLKPKDLIGIPWRVAFALQADGWYLRQDIIWNKPNPMPESVRDRCTKAHEYIFLLSKNERYYYDCDAVKEPIATAPNAQSRHDKSTPDRGPREGGNSGLQAMALKMRAGEATTRNRRSVWTVTPKPFKGAHFATFPPDLIEPCILAGCPAGGVVIEPFCGSGTVPMVAEQHGRGWLASELTADYCDIIRGRLA